VRSLLTKTAAKAKLTKALNALALAQVRVKKLLLLLLMQ
jgi:hypothetical protein